MSKAITDFAEHTSALAADDFAYIVRTGNPSGDRDRKVKATFASFLSGTMNGVAIGGVTPAAGAFTTISATGAAAFTGALTPTGGVAAAGGFTAPTVFHSGGMAPPTATTGTDTAPVTTETYIAEVFVPCNATLAGIALLNGSVAAGNIQIALANSSGVVVAQTASTAAAGTAAYQAVPFTSPYAAKGPAKYFVLLQNNNTANRFRSHILGNFGAAKKTGETYGTFTAITPPTTFTTGLGPICSTY